MELFHNFRATTVIGREEKPADFCKAYLKTLQKIIRFQEQDSGPWLNHVRDLMDSPEIENTPLARVIKQELLAHKDTIGYLYPDPKQYPRHNPVSEATWIMDEETCLMIGRHLETLDCAQEDLAQYAIFCGKVRENQAIHAGKPDWAIPTI